MSFQKAKLNYMSAVTYTEPKKRIKVSSTKMEELDRDIKEKVEKNKTEFNYGKDNLKDDIYYN